MTVRQIASSLAICLLIPLVVLIGRSEYEASEAWAAAESARVSGDTDEYLYQLQRCAKWNTAIGGRSKEARQDLMKFARQATDEKRTKDALIAWRYARGSILATNHVFRQASPVINEVNTAIAELMAAEQTASNSITMDGRSHAELIAEHESLLSRRNGPSPWGAIVIFMTFVLWVGSLFWMIWRGVRQDGGVNGSPLLRGGLASTTLFACFCWALFAL